MQKIKNFEVVVPALKEKLKEYLEDKGTSFGSTLFTCPNREEHKNEDTTPSCGFVPHTNNSIFNCFACGERGDIFHAYSLLENKPIKGPAFHVAVKELADKYKVEYEIVPLTEAEEQESNVNKFLSVLVDNAQKYLVESKPSNAIEYIEKRGWGKIQNDFQFGYLPDNDKTKKWIEGFYARLPYLQEYIKINPFQLVNRLMFPIKDTYGNIIGICDRKIDEDDYREKYQKYFVKNLESGEILFNLSSIYQEILLVEGGSSVFTLTSNGIKNCVSMLGLVFSENMYKKLVKHGVKKVVICFDGDDRGLAALKKTIKFFEQHPDIICYVKILDGDLDPDDYITKYGLSKFKELPEESIFNYQLNNYKNEQDDLKKKEYKKSLFEILYNSTEPIEANKMIEHMCKEIQINKKLVLQEMNLYNADKNTSDISVSTILVEEQHLLDNIEKFEQRAWRSGELLGIESKYPIFDKCIDGLQTGLILVSGKWNVGKSAFMQTMAVNMLLDKSNFVVYFSIDDSVTAKTIPRLLAIKTKVPINIISNPIYGIERNKELSDKEKAKYKELRENGIKDLKLYSGRLGVKDSIDGNDVDSIEKIIKTYRKMAGDRNLIIFVDFLNMVETKKKGERTEQESRLAEFFKHMSAKYTCPVVCTVESTKGILLAETDENTIKGSSSIQFRSDLTLLLYSDFEVNEKSKMWFTADNGEANPVVKMKISKNKFSGWKGDLYYKFTKDISTFIECDAEEQKSLPKLYAVKQRRDE